MTEDETAVGAANDETAVVARGTELAKALAWSDEAESTEPAPHHFEDDDTDALDDDDDDDDDDLDDDDGSIPRFMWVLGTITLVGVIYLAVMLGYTLHHDDPATAPAPTTSASTPAPVPPAAAPPPSEAPTSPSSTEAAAPPSGPPMPVVSSAEQNTICGWLRDPSWTMPQIESSTGDMLANDGWSYIKADLQRVIQGAMTNTCPDVHRSF